MRTGTSHRCAPFQSRRITTYTCSSGHRAGRYATAIARSWPAKRTRIGIDWGFGPRRRCRSRRRAGLSIGAVVPFLAHYVEDQRESLAVMYGRFLLHASSIGASSAWPESRISPLVVAWSVQSKSAVSRASSSNTPASPLRACASAAPRAFSNAVQPTPFQTFPEYAGRPISRPSGGSTHAQRLKISSAGPVLGRGQQILISQK